MEAGAVLPARGALYADARGADRWLRVTWHPAHNVFVVSIWREGRCVGTFHLDRGSSAEVIGDLAESLSAPVEITWTDPALSTRSRRIGERAREAATRLRTALNPRRKS
jgi:hypothetical protein